ncbi:MAG: hypothetical protein KKF74_01020 [Nanoarchaeota archaeon]|nr:hypothetical protein [Nanoarchaeota archaeon]
MESELENLLKDTESKFNELDRKISNKMNDEQLKIDSLKKKIKQAIVGLLIITAIGYGSVEAYKVKRKQNILFESSRYYQVMESETLETIAEKVCNNNYNLNKIIEFNKKFDENFDSIAEKGEIIHFPKKYIKNSGELINFINEKTQLSKKIRQNKNLVETTFNGDITKQGIDNAYGIIDELDYNSEKLKILKQDNYFNNDAILLLNQIYNFKDYINNKINSEIGKIDTKFKLINNIFYNGNWEKPGTIEKLEDLILKNNNLRYLYGCFGNTKMLSELDKIEEQIDKKKQDYFVLLDNVRDNINKEGYKVESLQRQLDPLLRLGLQNKELSLINQLKEKILGIKDHGEWKNEKRIEDQLDEYSAKINKLNFEVNNKFNYAIGMINEELSKYEKEIKDAEELNRLKGADVRLKYIIKNPLAMIKYRYELLGYSNGITRTNKLINKINSFIKN